MPETLFVSYGGTISSGTAIANTRADYRNSGSPATAAAARSSPRRPQETAQRDPVVDWLGGPGARAHRNHWVALDPATGVFLGRADELPDLRRWQAGGALVVFVDPPSEA